MPPSQNFEIFWCGSSAYIKHLQDRHSFPWGLREGDWEAFKIFAVLDSQYSLRMAQFQ